MIKFLCSRCILVIFLGLIAFTLSSLLFISNFFIFASVLAALMAVFNILYIFFIAYGCFKKIAIAQVICFCILFSISTALNFLISNLTISIILTVLLFFLWAFIFLLSTKIIILNELKFKRNIDATKGRISVYTLFGVFLLYVVCLITLFFGKTNWVWLSVFFPFYVISLDGTYKFFEWLFIWGKLYNVGLFRNIINIIFLISGNVLSFIFSDDQAFEIASGSINLILLIIIIILFSLPFITGWNCNRKYIKEIKNNDDNSLR